MKRDILNPALKLLTLGALACAPMQSSNGFSFIFAGDANGIDVVAHPHNYFGNGGVLNVTVGIDPTSQHAVAMQTSVLNVINTWNSLTVTSNNYSFDFANIPSGAFDFESVLLHEMGHSIGLAHVNIGSETGVAAADRDYTYSTRGANGVYDFDAGTDGVIGSSDDIRGDDVNLNYFKIADNDPFSIAGTVDSTTYSRDTADLPGMDTASAQSNRAVSTLTGNGTTEAVMNQGSFNNEIQRTLGADDVAGRLYQQAGADQLAGTEDDYFLNLQFAGLDDTANIVIDFDNSQTGFAVSGSSGGFHSANDISITDSNIYFNDGFNWFFNTELNAVPEPSTYAAIVGILALGFTAYRRKKA